jgi:hypothetical protein
VVLFLLGLPGLGCAAGDGETALPPPGLAADIQPLLDRNCVDACHGGAAPSGELDLSPGRAYDALVGVPSVQATDRLRVDPGDPDGSYLVAKLEGRQAATGGSGTGMPPAFVLSAGEIAAVRAWIATGAAE